MEKTSQTTQRSTGKKLGQKKNKVNFEIPKFATSTFWKLAPSLENSAKKQHGSKKKSRGNLQG